MSTMNLNDLDAATLTLLAKEAASAAKVARPRMDPGTYQLDERVQLQVTGQIKVGEDYTQQIVAKADPWLLLAAAMSHLNGVTMESITKEALTADPALLKSLKKQAADCIAACKAPTTTACKGKVTTKGSVEVKAHGSKTAQAA